MNSEMREVTVNHQPAVNRLPGRVLRPAPPRSETPPPSALPHVNVPAQVITEEGLGDAVFCVVVAMESLGEVEHQVHDGPSVPLPTALLGTVPATHVRAYALLAALEAAGKAATEEELAVFLHALHPEKQQDTARADARAALGNLQALGWVSVTTDTPPRHIAHPRPHRGTQ